MLHAESRCLQQLLARMWQVDVQAGDVKTDELPAKDTERLEDLAGWLLSH